MKKVDRTALAFFFHEVNNFIRAKLYCTNEAKAKLLLTILFNVSADIYVQIVSYRYLSESMEVR